jgi:hypothetical protein
MKEHKSRVIPVNRLHEAFDGRRCISAWLGYGEALFLGLGEEVLPEYGDDGLPSRPPFQLDTNFADWSVEGPITAVFGDSNPSQLEAAAGSLVGDRVVAWELLESKGLRVTFTGGKTLTVVPWDVADGLADAWTLRALDGQILAVETDGRVVVLEKPSN